jgi:hypothetical protein
MPAIVPDYVKSISNPDYIGAARAACGTHHDRHISLNLKKKTVCIRRQIDGFFATVLRAA